MKRIFIAVAILSQSLIFALPTPEEVEAVQTRPFELLLEEFGISPNASTAEIVAETERLWVQKGRERWEFDQRFEPMKEKLWPIFDQMGLLQAVKPSKTHYEYALICGSLLSSMQKSAQYLADLWEEGVRFEKIVFLTGQRPLQNSEKEMTGAETESQVAEWAYLHSELPKNLPVSFIDAPMKHIDGNWVRPNRGDTIRSWLNTQPLPGTCLVISNQPYVAYQKAVIQHCLSDEFPVETVGPGVKGSPSVALILDTIARELFWRNSK